MIEREQVKLDRQKKKSMGTKDTHWIYWVLDYTVIKLMRVGCWKNSYLDKREQVKLDRKKSMGTKDTH